MNTELTEIRAELAEIKRMLAMVLGSAQSRERSDELAEYGRNPELLKERFGGRRRKG